MPCHVTNVVYSMQLTVLRPKVNNWSVPTDTSAADRSFSWEHEIGLHQVSSRVQLWNRRSKLPTGQSAGVRPCASTRGRVHKGGTTFTPPAWSFTTLPLFSVTTHSYALFVISVCTRGGFYSVLLAARLCKVQRESEQMWDVIRRLVAGRNDFSEATYCSLPKQMYLLSR